MRPLFLFIFTPFLLAAPHAAPPQPLTEIPDDFHPLVSAPTLPGLQSKATPTLAYNYKNFHLFIWAKVDQNGRPVFSLATAHYLAATKSPAHWSLFYQPAESDGPISISWNGLVLPKVSIPLVKSQPEPNNQILWAQSLSHNPRFGTVYQLGYHLEYTGPIHCCADEHRAILLHSSDNSWHLLAFIDGASSDDTHQSDVKIVPTWTTNPAAPLSLTVTTTDTEADAVHYTSETYTGSPDHMTAQPADTYTRHLSHRIHRDPPD